MNIIRRAGCFAIIFAIALAIITMHAMAQETGTTHLDSGDTAWVLVSAALVMLMTPAVGLFYGGMVRKKVLFGYSLAFGPDKWHGLIGGLEWIGLNGVGAAPNPDYAATIPASVFMIFQAMFAIITPALITGAFADRMKFSTMSLHGEKAYL